MTSDMGCEQVRELAPELALGISEGEERDAALRHVTGCPGCRRLVSELTSVGDELLLLAPAKDPPSGFESRVLSSVSEPSTRWRLWPLVSRKRWFAAATAAVVLAAAFSGGSVFLATADDRRLANSYQSVLIQGQGAFFAAAPLQGPQGRAGTVFGYQGQPSWVMVTVQPSIRPEGRFQIQIVTRDGRYLPLGHTVLDGAGEAWGRQLPLDLSQVHELRFIGADGRSTFTATFNAVNPWD
jgi:hypothetical protein